MASVLFTASAAVRPRERLEARGASDLADAELLALVLRSGGAGRGALELAQSLIGHAGGLRPVGDLSLPELRALPGLGPAKAASIAAALEIGRRLAAHRLEPGQRLLSPEEVYRHFFGGLRDARHECFIGVHLDARQRVLSERLVSQGTLTASLVHPREVFRSAIRESAAALVLVHNHPSGDPEPSAEDREVTDRLARAGALLGVRVVDHVIVAERGYFSFREAGQLDEANTRF